MHLLESLGVSPDRIATMASSLPPAGADALARQLGNRAFGRLLGANEAPVLRRASPVEELEVAQATIESAGTEPSTAGATEEPGGATTPATGATEEVGGTQAPATGAEQVAGSTEAPTAAPTGERSEAPPVSVMGPVTRPANAPSGGNVAGEPKPGAGDAIVQAPTVKPPDVGGGEKQPFKEPGAQGGEETPITGTQAETGAVVGAEGETAGTPAAEPTQAVTPAAGEAPAATPAAAQGTAGQRVEDSQRESTSAGSAAATEVREGAGVDAEGEAQAAGAEARADVEAEAEAGGPITGGEPEAPVAEPSGAEVAGTETPVGAAEEAPAGTEARPGTAAPGPETGATATPAATTEEVPAGAEAQTAGQAAIPGMESVPGPEGPAMESVTGGGPAMEPVAGTEGPATEPAGPAEIPGMEPVPSPSGAPPGPTAAERAEAVRRRAQEVARRVVAIVRSALAGVRGLVAAAAPFLTILAAGPISTMGRAFMSVLTAVNTALALVSQAANSVAGRAMSLVSGTLGQAAGFLARATSRVRDAVGRWVSGAAEILERAREGAREMTRRLLQPLTGMVRVARDAIVSQVGAFVGEKLAQARSAGESLRGRIAGWGSALSGLIRLRVRGAWARVLRALRQRPRLPRATRQRVWRRVWSASVQPIHRLWVSLGNLRARVMASLAAAAAAPAAGVMGTWQAIKAVFEGAFGGVRSAVDEYVPDIGEAITMTAAAGDALAADVLNTHTAEANRTDEALAQVAETVQASAEAVAPSYRAPE